MPIRHFAVPDAPAMRALGVALGGVLPGGACVLLTGPLGAGKTTLTQGIGAGLGVAGVIASPTFTLVHELAGRAGGPGLVHMDFYRLTGPAEATALGLDDYLAGDDVVVIEWPERAAGVLPPDALRVAIGLAGDGRIVTLDAAGAQAARVLAELVVPAGVRELDGADVAGD